MCAGSAPTMQFSAVIFKSPPSRRERSYVLGPNRSGRVRKRHIRSFSARSLLQMWVSCRSSHWLVQFSDETSSCILARPTAVSNLCAFFPKGRGKHRTALVALNSLLGHRWI